MNIRPCDWKLVCLLQDNIAELEKKKLTIDIEYVVNTESFYKQYNELSFILCYISDIFFRKGKVKPLKIVENDETGKYVNLFISRGNPPDADVASEWQEMLIR